MKICNACGVEQEEDRFRPKSAKCRKCAYIKKLEWQANNPEKLRAGLRNQYRKHRDKRLAQMTARRPMIRAVVSAKRKADRKDPSTADYQYRFGSGRAHYLEKKRQYNIRSREKRRAYNQNRWRTDIHYKLRRVLRRFLVEAVKGESKSAKIIPLLGCPIESLRLYIESKFEPGMTWENHGKNGWELDHIMPMAIFDLTKEEHRKRCFHFSNLQPLWAKDNRAKSNKVLSPQFPLI